MTPENQLAPLPVFRFQVDFKRVSLSAAGDQGEVPLCQGAFAECSGLEATMEPKVIKPGGLNYGAVQRAGPVTFGTVILKRGLTTTRDLWTWFSTVNEKFKYAYRLQVTITLLQPSAKGRDPRGAGFGEVELKPAMKFTLQRALPVKFKAADLNARGTEVGVEELHLAHEGMSIE